MKFFVCSYPDIPEYTLTNEFCRKHFLIGLLLREVGFALQEDQDIRHLALAVLKNLMAKHSFDDRYAEPVKELFILSFDMFIRRTTVENLHSCLSWLIRLHLFRRSRHK